MSMFGELGRRNVFRVGIAYVIAAWVVIQVADLVLENIGAPDWVIQAIMLVVALGFPVALVFAWTLMQTGDEDRGRALLQEALRHYEDLFPKVIAHVDAYRPDVCYLAAAEPEKALAVIEQQFEHGHYDYWAFAHTLPLYDPIREHPRYLAVREQYAQELVKQREIAGL